ncbi:MAG: hypothetical protein IPL15_10155 [Comamonadaceae bacterium]|uniref:hypothetical protein n=1 Tax=Candidatus Skiveiella danica TaxID=3386177 RepID=UPI00390A3ECB|nr:hypothetical protein [Comamonadaceae bacterium]
MLDLPVPKLRGGKPHRRLPGEPVAGLRADAGPAGGSRPSGDVKPNEDNMLAITTDDRKATLDFRLVAPLACFMKTPRWPPARAGGSPYLATHDGLPRRAVGVL